LAITKILPCCFVILTPLLSLAQETHSLNWLYSNLNYSYFNPDQGKWWVNKFESNEKGVVHFQNMSTENPAKFSGKSWIDRRVSWINLDPFTIETKTIRSNKGRIVRGEVLIIHVIDDQRKIAKSLDGRRATPENFLQVSVPSQILDTASHFTDSLKYHFTSVIEENSMIVREEDQEVNVAKVFQVLRGDFSNGSVIRSYGRLFDKKLEFTEKLGAKPVLKGFFSFEDGRFQETLVSETIHETYFYNFKEEGTSIRLVSEQDAARSITLSSLHYFTTNVDGTSSEFKRLSYR